MVYKKQVKHRINGCIPKPGKSNTKKLSHFIREYLPKKGNPEVEESRPKIVLKVFRILQPKDESVFEKKIVGCPNTTTHEL